MKKPTLPEGLLICLSVFLLPITAKAQDKKFWSVVNESAVKKDFFAGRYKPKAYKLFQLDQKTLQTALKKAPSRKIVSVKNSSFIISIPNADGVVEKYKVVESADKEPVLAGKSVGIKAYRGQGVDDPSSTIGFIFSPYGFHGMILSSKRPAIYIEPVAGNDSRKNNNYAVFSKKDIPGSMIPFQCETEESSLIRSPILQRTYGSANADDNVLRTYKLALACTHDYAKDCYLSETDPYLQKSLVLLAMYVLVDRLNMIYERDFSIHLQLIPSNGDLIFIDADSDPWNYGMSDDERNAQTEKTIDGIIHSDNYDIGHLLQKANEYFISGKGSPGVCIPGSKASAFSSHPNPVEDPSFVEAPFAHEIGHQFGAKHTFSFRSDRQNAAVDILIEPGSGSTIMGYAGTVDIVSLGNMVQDHSDGYFHAISIEQVMDYVRATERERCGNPEYISNTTPIFVDGQGAGADRTIPASTPFVLTTLSSDADAGDQLTYTWEQFDRATTPDHSVPNVNWSDGPLFRSRPPSPDPSRTFPILDSILLNSNHSKWEILPTLRRVLNFRCTVRDNHIGGGANTSDDMIIEIDPASGPFKVTSMNNGAIFGEGSSQTVTWDVAGTYSGAINCTGVKISLSTDGGKTFPIVLKPNTLNDGTEEVTMPKIYTTTARIKIEAVDNIFFDISDHNFTIRDDEQEMIVKTDKSWKASNSPNAGWTSLDFDDREWYSASEMFTGVFDKGVGRYFIWGDNHEGEPNDVYLRKKFQLGDLRECYLLGHTEDDDAQVYINGNLVSSDMNDFAGPNVTNIDIKAYLIANATNVVAVIARNTHCCSFGFYLQILAGGNTYYADADGDGFGDPNISQRSCTLPQGYVLDNSDCNDNNSAIHPGEEICNGIDDNCDGSVDEGIGISVYFQDMDGDGFGSEHIQVGCTPPAGYVSTGGDCNDADPAAWNNQYVYTDADGDGYSAGVNLCYGATLPAGYSTTPPDVYDCDDADAAIWQGGYLYSDNDGDGYTSGYVWICYGATPPTGYTLTSSGLDCNDTNSSIQVCPSVNADLANMVISQGTLSPEFLSGTNNYTVFVEESVTSLTVTPTLADATATVKINGTPVSDGTASDEILLEVGSNSIEALVTAQDGTTTKMYTITVTRAAPPVITLDAKLSRTVSKSRSALSVLTFDSLGKKADPVTGVKDDVIIYPNPVIKNATISLRSSIRSNLKLKVEDSRGRLVSSKQTFIEAGSNLISVDMSNFASGVYYLVIAWGNQTKNIRVVKQ